MKKIRYQENTIEQVAAYTIQAGDILTNEINEIYPKYRCLFLPKGPELYTGPLKAAGYLLLDPGVKHVILITNQSIYPDNITIFDDKEGILTLGKILSVENVLLKNIKRTKELDEEILFQCNFLRIIKDISSISIIGIGINIKRDLIGKEIKSLIKSKEIGIIFYDTCSNNVEKSIARSLDEVALSNIINKKVRNLEGDTWLANIFVEVLPSKTKPRLLGYVNTGDFDDFQKETTSYVSLVG